MPAAFREAGDWVPVSARSPALPADWWRAYGDRQLDAFETKALVANPAIDAARAVRAQASAAVAESQATLWPTLGLQASSTRRRDATYVPRGNRFQEFVWSHSQFGLDASWEPDLWGGLGDAVNAAKSLEQGDEAALAGARLSITTLVAATYFDVRQMDADLALRRHVRDLVARELAMTTADLAHGRVSRDDLRRAGVALNEQEMKLAVIRRGRAASEHALAALLGQAPAEFQLEPLADYVFKDVVAPAALPSMLLVRRPEVRQSLAAVQAASSGAEAARTAWFPQIVLGAGVGREGAQLFQLMQLPTRLWSLGPSMAATLLDGGARAARLDAANARRDEAVALYRASVLAAFQDVEDLLSARRELIGRDRAAQSAYEQQLALSASQRKRLEVGLSSVRDEIESQREALEAQQLWIDGRHETRQTQLLLIKSIGGGWEAP